MPDGSDGTPEQQIVRLDQSGEVVAPKTDGALSRPLQRGSAFRDRQEEFGGINPHYAAFERDRQIRDLMRGTSPSKRSSSEKKVEKEDAKRAWYESRGYKYKTGTDNTKAEQATIEAPVNKDPKETGPIIPSQNDILLGREKAAGENFEKT